MAKIGNQSSYPNATEGAADCQSDRTFKYICSDKSEQLPEYRKGYKETAIVPGDMVGVVRIRWAKSHMTND